MSQWIECRAKYVAARVVGIAALIAIVTAAAFGQAKAAADASVMLPGAAYDVATIKPHDPSVNVSFSTLPNGGFIAKGTSLKNLACTAYGKFDFQVMGGPSWFDSDRYDVEAKPDGALAEQLEKLTPEQRWKVQNRMLQKLLEERLKLKAHEETKELPIFALVVAKGGLKIEEAKEGDTYSHGIKGPDGKATGASSSRIGQGKMEFQAFQMDGLAEQLSLTIDHIVEDKTGLKGKYDFTLRYSEDETGADATAPSIYTAVQEQLGLKLEPMKAPAPVLVIDHVERPSEN